MKLATGVQANQALAAGQVDWSGGGVESTVVAWATDLPFKAYSMYATGGDSYGILVRNEANIRSVKDLKGKRVAVPQGTGPAQGLGQVMQEAGLARDDVQRVNANFGNMGPMLVSGAVDAMAGLEPFLTLTQEQMAGKASLLLRLGKYVQGGGLFLISDKWAAAHPDKVADAVAALWELQQWVRQNSKEATVIEFAIPERRAAHRGTGLQMAELSSADRRFHTDVAAKDLRLSGQREIDIGACQTRRASGAV